MMEPKTERGLDDRSQGEGMSERARGFARDQVQAIAEETHMNQRAAARVGRYAQALSNMGDDLERDGARRFARYVQDIADRLFEIGDRIHDQDYRGASRHVRAFAAENPEVFLGMSFAAGAFVGHVARRFMSGDGENQGRSGQEPGGGLQTSESTPPSYRGAHHA